MSVDGNRSAASSSGRGDRTPVRGRVRLIDVARAAGVSKGVASRVLNNDPRLAVRPDTRERIHAVAEKLDYRPHAAASLLRGHRAGAVTLLIPDLTNPAMATISRGGVERALERQLTVLLVEDRDPAQADDVVRGLLKAGRIDGVIVVSAQPGHPLLRTLKRERVPHVFAHRAVKGSGRNVIMADEEASVLAVGYLRQLGHTRIAQITGPRSLTTSQRLESGFRSRVAAENLKSAAVMHVEYSETGGAEAARALFARRSPPTAIYTGSITQAVGVLHAAWELGVAVPEDVSLVACGELRLAEFINPPLTTVWVPFEELGAGAVDEIIDQLDGDEPKDVVVDVRPEIIIRKSTTPPR